MTRDQAYQLTRPRFKNKNLFKHVLAVEAVMRGLAEHFHEDVEKWGLVGLLHDLDYEETVNTPEQHTLVTETLLAHPTRIGPALWFVCTRILRVSLATLLRRRRQHA